MLLVLLIDTWNLFIFTFSTATSKENIKKMILNEWKQKRKLFHPIGCGSGSGSGSCFFFLDVEAEAVDKKKSLLEAEAEAIEKKISIFKWKRKRLKIFHYNGSGSGSYEIFFYKIEAEAEAPSRSTASKTLLGTHVLPEVLNQIISSLLAQPTKKVSYRDFFKKQLKIG